MTEKVIKRGYVKWTDEDGVFHKEPLTDHPELLAHASPKEQLHAEEARRLNNLATETIETNEEEAEETVEDTLKALRDAPADVVTAAQLNEDVPASAASESVEEGKKQELDAAAEEAHAEELAKFRERTSE